MLIDAHLHVVARKCYSDIYAKGVMSMRSRSTLPSRAPEPIAPDAWPVVDDPEGKKWAKDMKYLGVDIAVNQTVDWGSAEGWLGQEAPLSIEEINRHYCLLAQKYQGKLYSFVGVNPGRHNAVEILDRAVKEWGAKGLKLHPATGFYPNDRVCYRLYEKCAELGVPVLIHTGWGVFRYLKYCNPIHLDEPAKDFPEVEFIASHSGGGIGLTWEEGIIVARGNPNINLDLAEMASGVFKGGVLGNAGKYKDHVPMFLDMLDIMRNNLHGMCINIIFGTDYPFCSMEVLKQWVDLFKNLPAIAAQHGYDFSQEEADLICYKNAARIMKLDIKGI